MNDDTENAPAKDSRQTSNPEEVELEYVAREYGVSVERAKELVALFGDDESLIEAELTQRAG